MGLTTEEKNFYALFQDSFTFWKNHKDLNQKDSNSWIGKLVVLKWLNGSKIFNHEERDIFLEVLNLLRENDIEDVYDLLQQYEDKDDFIWNMPGLEDCEEAAVREIKILTTTEKGVIGAGECKYCPGKELVFTKKQTRRADEGMTIFVRCVTCGRRWRQ